MCFGTAKLDCVIKAREMFNFLPVINNSVIIGLSSLLLCISVIISSKMVDILRFFLGCILQCFYKCYPYHPSIQEML